MPREPSAMPIPARLISAIGGNATHSENIAGTSMEQKVIARQTAKALLPLALLDTEMIITHGTGPVVGKILMRQALTRVAALQGETGTHILRDPT